MTPFEIGLRHILIVEGKVADIDNDPGGITNLGISTPTWNAYLKKKNLPRRSVKEASLEEVKEIYYENYWLAENCQKLAPWTALLVFDVGVHSGPRNGSRLLQRSVKVGVDGIIGSKTLEAVDIICDPFDTIRRFCDLRAQDLHAIDKRQYAGKLSRGFNLRVRRLLEHSLRCFLEEPEWKATESKMQPS